MLSHDRNVALINYITDFITMIDIHHDHSNRFNILFFSHLSHGLRAFRERVVDVRIYDVTLHVIRCCPENDFRMLLTFCELSLLESNTQVYSSQAWYEKLTILHENQMQGAMQLLRHQLLQHSLLFSSHSESSSQILLEVFHFIFRSCL